MTEKRLESGRQSAPTIYDVAAKAGVSPSTVSRILKKQYNRYPQPTIEKVLRAAKTLRYVPNLMAQSLSLQRPNTVGVFGFYNPSGPALLEILYGVVDDLRKTGHGLSILNYYGDSTLRANLLENRRLLREIVKRRSVCGVIICGYEEFDRNDFRWLRASGTPAVLVETFNPEVDSIMINNFKGGMLGGEHLARTGRRRLAVVTGPQGLPRRHFILQRVLGCEKAIKSAGLDLSRGMVFHAGHYTFEAGYDLGASLLKVRPRINAIFCAAGDMAAAGLIRRFLEAGLRVPEDIAVVGYDDITQAQYMNPALTTVHQPLYEAGQAAAECIVNQLGKMREDTQQIILEPRLVVRQSA